MTAETRPRPDRRDVLAATLTAPTVWMLHLLLSYFVVTVACETQTFAPVIGGLSAPELVLVVLTVAAMVAVLISGRLGYRIWRESETGVKAKGGTEEDRRGFMGLGGAALSVLFLFGLLLAFLPPFLLLLRECGA